MYVAYKLYQQAGCEQFHKSMQPSAMSQARAKALDFYRKHNLMTFLQVLCRL